MFSMSRRFVCAISLAIAAVGMHPAWSDANAQAANTNTPAKTPLLHIAIKPAKPFAYQEDGKWKGFSVELWESIARKNKWQFEWVPTKTVPEALSAVQAGKVDVAIGALSITEEREQVLDFSQPFFESGLQIAAPAASTGTIWRALQGLLTMELLSGIGAILAVMLLVSWLLWLLERKRNEESFPQPMGQGMKEALWWSTNTLIAGGCENIAPSGTPGRLVAVMWMLGGIAFTSYITAVFTSTLTVDRMNTTINSVDDLKSIRVATVKGSSSEAFLNKQNVSTLPEVDIDTAMQALADKKAGAVVYDAPLIRYWLTTHEQVKDKLGLVGSPFARQHYGFALPIESPLRKSVNTAMLELRGEGYLEQLEQRWFGTNTTH